MWYENGHMLKNSTPRFIVIRYLIAEKRYLNQIEFVFFAELSDSLIIN